MMCRVVFLFCLVATIIDVLECQEGILGRRLLRGKFGRQSEEEEQSEVVADDEVVSPGRSRPRFRSRQRAMRGPLIQSARQRPGRRRPFGRRPGRLGGRRFPGRRPQPSYDYYDYYYDEFYDYYYDDDYYQDEAVEEVADPVSQLDTSQKIQELWGLFLKEKQQQSVTPAEPEYECPPLEDVSYYIPDEEQCDKYFECNIKGELKDKLCPDGFVFDIDQEKCDYPVKVNCTGRDLLQEPQPSVNCSRANGFFAWPANISCQNFWDCREGVAYKQTCPVGVIFDPQLNTCATPDQSSRKECTEGEESFLGFQCPRYSPDSVLRFGNHDRLPHPEDCQQYFTCLVTGGPPLANCGRKKVFNNATGQCSDPKDVPGCETYWIEKLKDEEEDEYYYDY